MTLCPCDFNWKGELCKQQHNTSFWGLWLAVVVAIFRAWHCYCFCHLGVGLALKFHIVNIGNMAKKGLLLFLFLP